MMEGGSDPISLLLTGGGSAGTGAILAYLMMSKMGKNGSNGNGDNGAVIAELKDVAGKLDETNNLLQELLRAQARMEGSLTHISNRG